MESRGSRGNKESPGKPGIEAVEKSPHCYAPVRLAQLMNGFTTHPRVCNYATGQDVCYNKQAVASSHRAPLSTGTPFRTKSLPYMEEYTVTCTGHVARSASVVSPTAPPARRPARGPPACGGHMGTECGGQ